ncbi:MAG: hypothetical protein A2Z21_01400 [Candidatus Fraserbacteria bacterium RBG_16_55_9]|uniref:Uncharacterized protein n=1 Tax=Fraserbacteria sp. (strain RBG_16_55_9) TaxID=1817864 RepID=A0A1F5URB4_FRAXR|nr:MAG: hypothetical protein A2Z21_01400 [Candidatus Fraserbacteria bacterium RBG_16_55_9]
MLLSIWRNVAGALLILVGLILLPVPILSGWALIIPGVLLLDIPGKREFFMRLEKTRWISRMLAKSPTLAKLWKRLYDGEDPGQQKPRASIIQLPF